MSPDRPEPSSAHQILSHQLGSTARNLLHQVESETGHPVVLRRVPIDLHRTYAHIKYATAHLPHVISLVKDVTPLWDYLVAHECAHASRLFALLPIERRVPVLDRQLGSPGLESFDRLAHVPGLARHEHSVIQGRGDSRGQWVTLLEVERFVLMKQLLTITSARRAKALDRGKYVIEIDAMVAGPDMDDLVAERVIGWVWVAYKPGVGSLPSGQRFLVDPHEYATSWFTEHYCDRARGDEPIYRKAMNTPPYSTDMVATWKDIGELIDRVNVSGPDAPNTSHGLDYAPCRPWSSRYLPRHAEVRGRLTNALTTASSSR